MSTSRRPLAPEQLEPREVPSAVRAIDESNNNLQHPTWGTADTDFLRVAAAAYTDGVSIPAGATRPSAREVSNVVDDQSGGEILNDRQMSALVYAWGQFIDHDLDLTESGTASLPISVPAGDPSFDPTGTGTQTLSFTRSAGDPATGTSTANPRQQVNTITSYLDGSMVYGSDQATANSLRTFQGGQLKTSAGNLLPTDAYGYFLAGDTRVNENPELTSLQTLFMREHNRLAAQFGKADPTLTDEQLYQKARAWVIGELQAITYNEWLPTLTGSTLAPYRGYSASVNPGVSNEFATAAFRFGHSIVGGDIQFLGNDGSSVAAGLSFADAFFDPAAVTANGIDPLLKYLASDPSQELDTKVVDELRNLLLTSPGGDVRMDLAALNIQRGRDHGLADYNTTRVAFGLPRVTDFSQITSDTGLQAKLKAEYGSVNNIDLWVGLLAENHLPGSSVGATLKAILTDQFSRLRSGDRFWYENTFTGADLAQLRNTHLADIIRRNTSLTTVQPNPFVFHPTVAGTVTVDGRSVGRLTVSLLDDSRAVVVTTTTDASGHYQFDVAAGLTTGKFTVRATTADGRTATSPAVQVVNGDSRLTVNLSIGAPPRPPGPPRQSADPGMPPLHGARLRM